jgi:hypothetical protein
MTEPTKGNDKDDVQIAESQLDANAEFIRQFNEKAARHQKEEQQASLI